MSKVDVVLAHPWGKGNPGDRVTVSTDDALRLVRAGYASYATQTDAKAAGAAPAPSAKK